jgi:phytoene dehydrogenase-like protein
MILPSRREQASCQRRLLLGLRGDYGRLLEHLLALRVLLKGSVYELQTRCGKPSCHCASPQGPRHSTTVLSWSDAGRTRLRSVAPQDRARWRRLAADYRRFRQCRAGLVKIHRQVLRVVDRLEKALLWSPPQKKSRSPRRRG